MTYNESNLLEALEETVRLFRYILTPANNYPINVHHCNEVDKLIARVREESEA